MRSVFTLTLCLLLTSCYSGRPEFHPIPNRLALLTVGKTTPEQAERLLLSAPRRRIESADGSEALITWQRVHSSAFGDLKIRQLVLRFEKGLMGAMRLARVESSLNVTGVPEGLRSGGE